MQIKWYTFFTGPWAMSYNLDWFRCFPVFEGMSNDRSWSKQGTMLQFHPESNDASMPYNWLDHGSCKWTQIWQGIGTYPGRVHSYAPLLRSSFTVAKNMQEGDQMADNFLWDKYPYHKIFSVYISHSNVFCEAKSFILTMRIWGASSRWTLKQRSPRIPD